MTQHWKCRDQEALTANQTLIMGVLNVTLDSFSDGGRFIQVDQAVSRGVEMINQGAGLIDVGGESSRPGSEPILLQDELDRVIPVISSLSGKIRELISIDTTKAEVARQALNAGAHIVNDISGLTHDPEMAGVVSAHGAGLVIMHMQGKPTSMQDSPHYHDVVAEISDFLCRQIDTAVKAGIDLDRIVVDPGIGFGKTLEHNLEILRNLDRISKKTGRPVLIGASRKKFIGTITGRDTGDRLAGSLAVMAYAIGKGARIIRVHDVKESCDVARMIDTVTTT